MTPSYIETQEFINQLLKVHNFSQDELSLICQIQNYIELKKGEEFLKTGKVCDRLGILTSGLLMAHFESHGDKLNVSRFFYIPDNTIVTSFESFKNRTPSNETIVAIEDCRLFYFTQKDLMYLYETIPSMDRFGREVAENSYIKALERVHDLQVHDTRERAIKFFKKNPELYNRVSKKHLSSYLGMNRNDLTKSIRQIP